MPDTVTPPDPPLPKETKIPKETKKIVGDAAIREDAAHAGTEESHDSESPRTSPTLSARLLALAAKCDEVERAEMTALADSAATIERVKRASDLLAEDEALWCIELTAGGAYMLQELRALCALIETGEATPGSQLAESLLDGPPDA
jgi:hypothetical protein